MPNWSCNRLYVKGEPLDVKEFTDTLGTPEAHGDDAEFSFHQTVPRPAPLDIEAGSDGELGYAIITNTVVNPFGKIDEYKARFEELDDEKKKDVIKKGLVYKQNMDNHGAVNWYEWSITHWGTKWDACEVDIDLEGIRKLVSDAIVDGDEEVTIDIGFDTAWAPPVEWMVGASERFTQLEFTIAYSEQGMDFCGTATAVNGEVTEEPLEGGCQFGEEGTEEECEPIGDYYIFLEEHSIGSGG